MPNDKRRIELFYLPVNETLEPRVLAEYQASLSPDELERLRRIAHAESRRLFLAGRGLLREVLSQRCGVDARAIEFQYNAYGKPSLKTLIEPPLEFNVSHTRGLAVCAISPVGQLGVDVERERRIANPLQIARRFCAPAEAAALERLPAARRVTAFLELWTLREALVKARGDSIFSSPAGFAFSLADDGPAHVAFDESSGENREEWQFFRLRLAGRYRAALAVARPASEQLEIAIHRR